MTWAGFDVCQPPGGTDENIHARKYPNGWLCGESQSLGKGAALCVSHRGQTLPLFAAAGHSLHRLPLG